MIDKIHAEKLKNELTKQEEEREASIRLSRDIIKTSKLIIYAIHRDDFEEAEKNVSLIKEQMTGLPQKPTTGMVDVAKQEYAEALQYYIYEKEGRVVTADELNLGPIEYLLGLCDFTGELVRRGINSIVKGNFDRAKKIRDLVEEIHGLFLTFDIRNNELRKKGDGIKYNLKRLEDALFELHLRRG